MPQSDSEGFILDLGRLGKPARESQVDRLESNDLAEFGARVVEAPAEFRERGFRGRNALNRLLQVAFAGATALEAGVDV